MRGFATEIASGENFLGKMLTENLDILDSRDCSTAGSLVAVENFVVVVVDNFRTNFLGKEVEWIVVDNFRTNFLGKEVEWIVVVEKI